MRHGHAHLLCDEAHILIARHGLLQEIDQLAVVPRRRGWNGRRHHDLMEFSNDLLDGIAPDQSSSHFLRGALLLGLALHLLSKLAKLGLDFEVRSEEAAGRRGSGGWWGSRIVS